MLIKSFVLRLMVALVTFFIGLGAGAIRTANKTSTPIPVKQVGIVERFRVIEKSGRSYAMGNAGKLSDGSFITLLSSDGMSFTKLTILCRSEERAKKEMESRLRPAIQIASREPVLDNQGQQIGEKVVALMPPASGDGDRLAAKLIWTEHQELFQVSGASLKDILEYRKDFNR